MKKLLCFLLCLTLIFSSVSLSFAAAADWSTSDQQNLQNVASRLFYMNQSAAYYLYNIASNTQNIYNKLVDVYNALFSDGKSVGYWLSAIDSFMSPILTAIQQTPLSLDKIYYALGTTYNDNGSTVYRPFLSDIYKIINYTGLRPSWVTYPNRTLYQYNGGSGTLTSSTFNFSDQGILGTLSLQEFVANENTAKFYADLMGAWSSPYTRTRWTDLVNEAITPTSGIRGIVAMLEWIQQPVARLSYVLASDERIEAQEAAAANEEAVVDNFIDSSSNGSTSPSDIGSVSDLSSGYKQNFGSDASVSGIFNIFDSNNMGWFSQETKNQLDTTTTRLIKGSESETPLLDKQIDEIYDALGVKNRD